MFRDPDAFELETAGDAAGLESEGEDYSIGLLHEQFHLWMMPETLNNQVQAGEGLIHASSAKWHPP